MIHHSSRRQYIRSLVHHSSMTTRSTPSSRHSSSSMMDAAFGPRTDKLFLLDRGSGIGEHGQGRPGVVYSCGGVRNASVNSLLKKCGKRGKYGTRLLQLGQPMAAPHAMNLW